jgi:hypothetical protein
VAKTRHIQQRMNKRAIRQSVLEIAHIFGVTRCRGDVNKVTLNIKGIDQVLIELELLKKRLSDARKKGGVTIVEALDGTEITTYRVDSFRRKH